MKNHNNIGYIVFCTQNKKVELTIKPGSVVNSHSSRADVTICLKQPTRERCGPHQLFPYLVLLQVGFTMPLMLPLTRCALTAPFHPYPATSSGAVYFLLHWPWDHSPQALPGTLPIGARTFLPSDKSKQRLSRLTLRGIIGEKTGKSQNKSR